MGQPQKFSGNHSPIRWRGRAKVIHPDRRTGDGEDCPLQRPISDRISVSTYHRPFLIHCGAFVTAILKQLALPFVVGFLLLEERIV
jgi:hypothetical protein